MTARENPEIVCFEFEYHSASDSRFLARRAPCVFRKFANHRLGLGQCHVLLEGVLSGDGLCRPVGNDLVVIEPSRQLVKTHAKPTEATFEC